MHFLPLYILIFLSKHWIGGSLLAQRRGITRKMAKDQGPAHAPFL